MNDKTWFTKLCDLGLSFEEYIGLVVAIEVEHFKSKSGKFVPIEKSSGVPHKCSQNPNAYTNGQQQAQQQPKQPSRDPDDMLFWDGLTHTQMVAKVFEVYGEEWMKQREQQQLKLLHARITHVIQLLEDQNKKMEHLTELLSSQRDNRPPLLPEAESGKLKDHGEVT
jgi:hypothetical protein